MIYSFCTLTIMIHWSVIMFCLNPAMLPLIFEPLIFEPLIFEPLIFEPLTLNLCYDPFAMNLWNELWYDFDLNPSVWDPSHYLFPSHGGTMTVSLMHLWHDSCVGEWFPIPSPYLILHGHYEDYYLGRMDRS